MDIPKHIDPTYLTKKRKPTTIRFWNKYLELCAFHLRQQIHIRKQNNQNFLCFPLKKVRMELGRYRIDGNQVYAWDVFFPLHPFFDIDKMGTSYTGLTQILLRHKAIKELFKHVPEQASGFDDFVLNELPVLPINRTSLDNYIKTQTNNLEDPSKDKGLLIHIKENIAAAKQIADLADKAEAEGVAKDHLPYQTSGSKFGRTYHKGTNLISCPSEVRHAALGDCWELDLENAVLAYKLSMVEQVHPFGDFLKQNTRCSRDYLLDKKEIRSRLTRKVISACHALPELQYKRHWKTKHEKDVKQALTAIMFGAGKSAKSWVDKNGQLQSTALKDIFKEQVLMDVFLEASVHETQPNQQFVSELIEEQGFIDDAVITANKDILDELEKAAPEFMDTLKNKRGAWNKKALVAFFYQHAEKELMNEVCDLLGGKVLLRVHDAVYIKGSFDIEELNEIAEQHGKYFKFGKKRHKAYGLGGYNKQLEAHKTRMEKEIAAAKNLKSNSSELGTSLSDLLD